MASSGSTASGVGRGKGSEVLKSNSVGDQRGFKSEGFAGLFWILALVTLSLEGRSDGCLNKPCTATAGHLGFELRNDLVIQGEVDEGFGCRFGASWFSAGSDACSASHFSSPRCSANASQLCLMLSWSPGPAVSE